MEREARHDDGCPNSNVLDQHVGPLGEVPIACTFTQSAGRLSWWVVSPR